MPHRHELLQSKGEAAARVRELQQRAKLEQEVLRMDTEAVMATVLDEAQLRSIARASVDRAEPGGLKWRKIGDEPPGTGRQLANVKLANALTTRTEFSQTEWDAFGIHGLRSSDFVMAGGSCFRPIVAATLHHADDFRAPGVEKGARMGAGAGPAIVKTPAIRRGRDVVFHSAVAGEEVELKAGWTRLGQRKTAGLECKRAWRPDSDEEEEDEEEKAKREEVQERKERLQHLIQLCAAVRADTKSAQENIRGLRLRSRYAATELLNCVQFASEPSRKAVEACLADLAKKSTPLLPCHVIEALAEALMRLEDEVKQVRQQIINDTRDATQRRTKASQDKLAAAAAARDAGKIRGGGADGEGGAKADRGEGGLRGRLTRPGPAGTWYVKFFDADAGKSGAKDGVEEGEASGKVGQNGGAGTGVDNTRNQHSGGMSAGGEQVERLPGKGAKGKVCIAMCAHDDI